MRLDAGGGSRTSSSLQSLSVKPTILSEPVPDFEVLAEPIRKDFTKYTDLSQRGDAALLKSLHRAGVEFFPVMRRHPTVFDKARRKRGISARIVEIQAIHFLFGPVHRDPAHEWARTAVWLGENCVEMTTAEMLKVAKDRHGMSAIANLMKKRKQAQDARTKALLTGKTEPTNETKLFEEIQAVLESVEPNTLIRPEAEFGKADDKISLYLGVRCSSGHEGLYEVLLKDVTHYRRFAISVRRNSEPVRTREATWDEVEEAGSRGLERQGAKEAETV